MGFDEADYFPSYDRLAAVLGKLPRSARERELDLLGIEPRATAKIAAVVIATRGIMMSSWRSTLEMTPAAAEKIPAVPLPVPSLDDPTFTARSYSFREAALTFAACSYCAGRPGFELCGLCGGSGTFGFKDDKPQPCSACSTSGFVGCRHCAGSRTSARVRVVNVSEERFAIRRVFVPSLIGTIDDAIRERLGEVDVWPDELTLSLEPQRAESAYRGPRHIETNERFADYDLLDAPAQARAFLASLQGVLVSRVHAWAIPFLAVRWTIADETIDVAVVPTGSGWTVISQARRSESSAPSGRD